MNSVDSVDSSDRYSPPGRVTLICHASTSAVRRVAFPLDEPVEETWLKRISSSGWVAPRTNQVLTAPELRTRQTAEALGLAATVDDGLRECGYGSWCGMELADLQEREPEALMAWLVDVNALPGGGETAAHLMTRMSTWLEDRREAGHTLAVTHPAVVRAAVVAALDAPIEVFRRVEAGPLTVTDLRFNGRMWALRSVGCDLLRSQTI